jgi:thiamine transport system substrate-binding protein
MMKTVRVRASSPTSIHPRIATSIGCAALLLAATGCSTMGDTGDSASEPSASAGSSSSAEGEVGGTVVLVTHSSFALPKKLVRSFESDTGIDLVTRSAGDGGTLTAKLSLTKDDPTGDVAFGVDNTFASRPLDEGVFASYAADLPPGAEQYSLDEGGDRLTPVDVGDVCVNVDTTWFEREGIAPPRTLDDLTDPAYEGLFVTPGASTSSPGMAFLLSTIAEYGEGGWQDYWTDLLANGTKVVDGWEDAYYGDFTQGGGEGERPIVLSYDSSPAFTVDGGSSTTAALLDTCFRQVEYAGVLEGAANPAGAEAVVDWLLSDEVQAALPRSMYVYPVSDDVEVPTDWARYAEQPTDPYEVAPADIAAHREQWLTEWTDVISR